MFRIPRVFERFAIGHVRDHRLADVAHDVLHLVGIPVDRHHVVAQLAQGVGHMKTEILQPQYRDSHRRSSFPG
jgi:hypothetical protein